MTYGNSKLSCCLHRFAPTDISPENFHLYRRVANDISPLLRRYINPSASDVSGLIYVDPWISIYTEQKQTMVGMLLWCSYKHLFLWCSYKHLYVPYIFVLFTLGVTYSVLEKSTVSRADID